MPASDWLPAGDANDQRSVKITFMADDGNEHGFSDLLSSPSSLRTWSRLCFNLWCMSECNGLSVKTEFDPACMSDYSGSFYKVPSLPGCRMVTDPFEALAIIWVYLDTRSAN